MPRFGKRKPAFLEVSHLTSQIPSFKNLQKKPLNRLAIKGLFTEVRRRLAFRQLFQFLLNLMLITCGIARVRVDDLTILVQDEYLRNGLEVKCLHQC